MIPRILFILKRREDPWGQDNLEYSYSMSSGLFNSVRFLVNMLRDHGVNAVMEEVIDNNCIDKVITKHRPTHVIVEAFWVVPEKFDVLKKLHPSVRWIVRNHSEVPFLANEGVAFGWTIEYLKRGVEIMSNSRRARRELRAVANAHGLPESLLTYGPNVYPDPGVTSLSVRAKRADGFVDVGCFGAVRPLKNTMQQAIAALAFADATGKKVRFHVNSARVEGGGAQIVKNLRALFSGSHSHRLVEHGWLTHPDFLKVLRRIEILMQVSYSETFNIVAADAMAMSVPLVVSDDIPWIGDYAVAEPNDVQSMVDVMLRIWNEDPFQANVRLHRQRRDLMLYCRDAESQWLGRFQPSLLARQ
jgi:glycosyltransferase involved in cell wall biosynthesis